MSRAECRKLTPVLYVPTIEPSLAFWRDRVGLAVTAEVPGEGGLAFAILAGNGIELMLQTAASLAADPHAAGMDWRGDRSALFVEVEDIDALAAAMDGCQIIAPRHETFYGATEIAYRAPGGHFVTFAQFARG